MKIFKLNVLQLVAVGALVGGLAACGSEQKVQRPRIEVTMAPLGVGVGSVPWPAATHPSLENTVPLPDGTYLGPVGVVEFKDPTEPSWDGTYAELLATDAMFACSKDFLDPTDVSEFVIPTTLEMYDAASILAPEAISDADQWLHSLVVKASQALCGLYGDLITGVVEQTNNGNFPSVHFGHVREAWVAARGSAACNIDPTTGRGVAYEVPNAEDQKGSMALRPLVDGRTNIVNPEINDEEITNPNQNVTGDASTAAFERAQSAMSYASRSLCMARRMNEHMQSQQVAAMAPGTSSELQKFVQERALTAVAQYTVVLRAMIKLESSTAPELDAVEDYPLVLGWYYSQLFGWDPGGTDENGNPVATGRERIAEIGRDYADAIGLLASSAETMGKHVLRDEGKEALVALLHGPNAELPAFAQSGFDGPGAEALLSLARGADALKLQVESYVCEVAGSTTPPCSDAGSWAAVRVRESAQALYDAVEVELRSRECDLNLESEYCDVAAQPGALGGSYLASSKYGASLSDAQNIVSTLAELAYGAPAQRSGDGLFYLVEAGGTTEVSTMKPSVYLSATLSGNKHQFLANTPQSGTDTLHIDRNFDYRAISAADAVTKGGLLDVVALPGTWDSTTSADDKGFGFRGLWQDGGRPVGAIPVLAAARSLTQSIAEASSVPTELTDSLSAAMPLLQATLGEDMVQMRVDVDSNGTTATVCAYVYEAEHDADAKWAFEYISDGLASPYPPADTSEGTDDFKPVTETPEVASAIGDSYLTFCQDSMPVPDARNQGLALVRYGLLGAGRRVLVVSGDTLSTTTTNELPPVFVASNGSFQAQVNRVLTASEKNWSKPKYDALDLPTDWNPTASAELFGGSESEEAYQYFLRAAKEAGKEATAATEKAFANLRQQEVDDLALEQAEVKGGELRALEQEAVCGTGDCGQLEESINERALFGLPLATECVSADVGTELFAACEKFSDVFQSITGRDTWSTYGMPFPELINEALENSSMQVTAGGFEGSQMGEALLELRRAALSYGYSLVTASSVLEAKVDELTAAESNSEQAKEQYQSASMQVKIAHANAQKDYATYKAGVEDYSRAIAEAEQAVMFACGRVEVEGEVFDASDFAAPGPEVVAVCSERLCHWYAGENKGTSGGGGFLSPKDKPSGPGQEVIDAAYQTVTSSDFRTVENPLRSHIRYRCHYATGGDNFQRDTSGNQYFDDYRDCLKRQAIGIEKGLRKKNGNTHRARVVSDYVSCEKSKLALEGVRSSAAKNMAIGSGYVDLLALGSVGSGGSVSPETTFMMNAIQDGELAAATQTASLDRVQATRAGVLAAVGELAQRTGTAYLALDTARHSVIKLLAQAKSIAAKLNLEQSLETAQVELRFSLKRKYNSYDLWRARALLENARRLAVAARRSIEGRFVVDLSDLHAPEPFVESPAIWADEIYASDLKPPAALGRTSGAAAVSGAVYSSAIEDYVTNLDLFVKGYAVARPTSIAKRDTEVIQLPAPAGVATAVTSGGGYSYVDPDSAQWSFYCPKQNAWISNPHLTEFGLTDASLATACGDSPPSRARLGFWLDPWGRYNGDFNSSPPYELRHNARWQQLAVNLVGTGVRDCSKAEDPLVCYAEPFIRYNLRHVGPAVVSDYQGTFKTLTIPSAVIEGGKALASEQWVDPVTQGFQSTSVANVARYEYAGRPLGGTYELMLELTPDVRLERIQRIQLVAQTDYWVRQLGSDSPVDPTLLVSQCGNGILEADETCEMVINGVAPTAESDAGVGAPICPASCDDNDPATLDVTGGVAALCTSTCEHQLIGRCLSGDGFCPPSCTSSEDSDCNTGTLVSWVSSGDYVTDTNVTAEPRFGWVPGASLLEGNRDLLSGEITPFGTSNAPVMSYDAGAGRETFVQIEGERTNLAPSSPTHSNVTPRVVGEGGAYFWTNGGLFEVRSDVAPGLDGAFEADEIAFVPASNGVRFRTEGTTLAGAHTVSVFHRGTGVPAVWRLHILRDSAGTLDADQAPLYPSATDTWERAVHTRPDFAVGDLVMPFFGVWQSTEMSELYPTGPVLFDMWQVEAGTFPSSPITTRGATRPENHLVVPAQNVPEAVRSGLWSFRFVPYFASNDALDGGAGAKAHVLSFNDGSNGLTVSAEPNALVQGELDQFGNFLPPTTTGQVAITSMDGDTNYHSTNLTWDRYDTLEVSFDFTQNRVLVHNLTAEAAGDVQAAPATDFSGSPAILRTFDMWVGKQAANEATEFFGLVSQPKATQFSNGVAAVCGDGLLEGGETCDDGDALSLCKSSCKSDNLACTSDVLLGSAAECDAYCAYQPIVQCQNGDGCCPTGCTAFADDDCGGPATYFSVVEHFDAAKGVTASDDQVDGWVGAIASVQLTAALTTERPTWVTGANGNPGLRFEGADADELSGAGLSIFESGGDEGYQLLVVGVDAVGGSSEPLSTVSASASGGDFELKSVSQGEAVRGVARGDSAEVSALLGSGPHIVETWVESGTVHTRVDGGATSTASWGGTFAAASDLLTLGGAAAGEFTLYEAVYANRAPNFNAATAYRASLQAKYGLDKDPNTLFGDRLMSWHRADRGVELKSGTNFVERWEDQSGRGANLISTGENPNPNPSGATQGAPEWKPNGDAEISYPFLEFNHYEYDALSTETKVDWTGFTSPQVYMVMRLRSDGNGTDPDPAARYFLYRMGKIGGGPAVSQPNWSAWSGGPWGMRYQLYNVLKNIQPSDYHGDFLGVTQLQSANAQPRFDLMVNGLVGDEWSISFDDGVGTPGSVTAVSEGQWNDAIDFSSSTPVGEMILGSYNATARTGSGASYAHDVDIAEVMLIEGPLSPSEEAELRTYLSNRYTKSW